jgi:hypothetical protein
MGLLYLLCAMRNTLTKTNEKPCTVNAAHFTTEQRRYQVTDGLPFLIMQIFREKQKIYVKLNKQDISK